LIRLAVRVRRSDAEIVLAELLELAPSGVEEVAIGDGSPGELPALPELEAAAGGALVSVTTTEIADDWSERWREFHRPLVLGDRLTVRPPWEPPGDTELDVVIDPAQAFGTGAHATTRLCLELMLSLAREPGRGSFVDVGCGSGVLAIVAARLGFEPVTALDYDPAAVDATRANAGVNGVELEARRFDLRTDRVPDAGLVAANVLAPQLLAWGASGRGRWPDQLILSGILAGEADPVATVFAGAGLRERRREQHGEWVALLLDGASRGVQRAADPGPSEEPSPTNGIQRRVPWKDRR
jgi:ribosomal protein L11 methyltransferase